MRRFAVCFTLLLVSRAALAVTCGGFSLAPSDHVIIQYSAPLPAGAILSGLTVSAAGADVAVSRRVSGGSATDVACVDDRVDLGYVGAGRFNLTWTDSIGFTTQHSTFTFFVGAPAGGAVDYPSVLPPLTPDRPVRLEVNGCSPRPPVAYLTGNNILVSQDDPQTPCRLYVLDFGLLPAGVYNVTVSRLSVAPWAQTFSFVVQKPVPASACSGTFSVTRTDDGTARLRFEDAYRGYTPLFGTPAVTEISNFLLFTDVMWPPSITIVQPVADTANSTASGAAPSSTICHAEELNLGPLTNGFHQILWYDWVSVNGSDAGFRIPANPPFSFFWEKGTVQCTSSPQFLTPSAAIEGASFDLAMNILALYYQFGGRVTVTGHTVTIDVTTFFEGPGDSLPTCRTYGGRIPPLAAGEYDVVWHVGARDTFASHLTVTKPARRRAAGHS